MKEKVIVWVDDDSLAPGRVVTSRYIVQVLDELGLRAHLKIVETGDEWNAAVRDGEPEAYLGGWLSNYPTASDFISPTTWCRAYHKFSGLCSERLNAIVEDAVRLQATNPAAASSAWAEIDHQVVQEALVVPLSNPLDTFAVSGRVRNIQVHPRWGILLSRLWVQ